MVIVIIIVGLFLLNQTTLILGEEPASLLQTEKEKIEMKVNFHTLDREKLTKGEFVGTAELKDGELIIDVTDPELEKILNSPYTTMTGEVREGVAMDRLITYQPGTLEHLQAIAIECYRFGYIGEVVEKE